MGQIAVSRGQLLRANRRCKGLAGLAEARPMAAFAVHLLPVLKGRLCQSTTLTTSVAIIGFRRQRWCPPSLDSAARRHAHGRRDGDGAAIATATATFSGAQDFFTKNTL